MMIRVICLATFLVGLTACGAGQSADSGAGCEVTDDSQVLTNEADGYCLAYPAGYCQWELSGGDITIVGGKAVEEDPSRCQNEPLLLHGEVAWVSLNAEPANGRTVEQVVEAYGSELGVTLDEFGIERLDSTLDGEAAVMLDGAPGQDLMRVLYVVHEDTLYQLTFVPAGEDSGEQYTEMLALYDQVVESFRVLD
jgi:hypothetical protein